MKIEWGGERFELMADRAVHWPARSTLIVTDTHFGKAASFRHASIPVPAGTTSRDLQRLTVLLTQTGAQRLLILGDFFHARTGRAPGTLEVIAAWRRQHASLAIDLVRGNHDERAGDPPEEWGIAVHAETLRDGPLVFCHHPCEREDGFVMAGHEHPAVRLESPDGSRVRMPCFCFGVRQALLPAFGSFTGARRIRPRSGDRVFVPVDGEVVEVRTADVSVR